MKNKIRYLNNNENKYKAQNMIKIFLSSCMQVLAEIIFIIKKHLRNILG